MFCKHCPYNLYIRYLILPCCKSCWMYLYKIKRYGKLQPFPEFPYSILYIRKNIWKALQIKKYIYIYKNIFVRVLDRKNLHEQSLQKYRKKKKSLKSHYEKMQTKNNNRQSITLIYHKIIFVENLLHKFLSCITIISLDLNWK